MKHFGSAALVALGILALGASSASAAVVCNEAGDCWRTKNTPIPQRLGSASTRTIGSGGPTISTDGASTRAAVIGAPTAFGSEF